MDVSDLDPATLLLELWYNTTMDESDRREWESYHESKTPTIEDAQNYIRSGNVDYFFTRPIKINFTYMEYVNFSKYDHYAGKGTFQQVVNKLRNLC